MIEIECRKCGRKHHPPILARRLLCCPTSKGLRYLVAEYVDTTTGREWFAVSKDARVRVIVKEGGT